MLPDSLFKMTLRKMRLVPAHDAQGMGAPNDVQVKLLNNALIQQRKIPNLVERGTQMGHTSMNQETQTAENATTEQEMQTSPDDTTTGISPILKTRATQTDHIYDELLRNYANYISTIADDLRQKGFRWNRGDRMFKNPPGLSIIDTFQHLVRHLLVSEDPMVHDFENVLTRKQLQRRSASLSSFAEASTSSSTKEGKKKPASRIPKLDIEKARGAGAGPFTE